MIFYAIIYIDMVHFNLKQDDKIIKKVVYKTTTEEMALNNLDKFEEKWDKKYHGTI